MKHLVIGLGEVGKPLQQMLGADGYDLNGEALPWGPYDVIHIAYPYGPKFIHTVIEYRDMTRAGVTIIHSTVPIGTTKRIAQQGGPVCHSPVFGRHDNMLENMKLYPKPVGGLLWLGDMGKYLPGFKVLQYANSEETEALKLLDLAVFGAEIAFQRYATSILKGDQWNDWLRKINSLLPVSLRRPILDGAGPIGGHCVVPGARLLAESHPSPLLQAILQHDGTPDQHL